MPADDATSATRPRTLHEAFANTAKALRQFGVERVRVVGLSDGCADATCAASVAHDGVRVVTEQQFMREFVFHSRPCVIVDAVTQWPAMRKWRSDRYLFDLDATTATAATAAAAASAHEQAGNTHDSDNDDNNASAARKVTVALTPNGRADAVTYVVYDERDVPASARARVCDGTPASRPVRLRHHPALQQETTTTTAAAACNDTSDGSVVMTSSHVRAEKVFMYAAEVQVTLPELYALLARSPLTPPAMPTHIDMRRYGARDESSSSNDKSSSSRSDVTPVIAYAQLQNNCLHTEYTHLRADIVADTVEAFGTRVFGEATEAANVWFGVPASVSSLHQDWVENLYTVVRGVKEFVLIAPWEGVLVPKPELPAAAFALDDARSDAAALRFAFAPYPDKDGTTVPWMDFELTPEMIARDAGNERTHAHSKRRDDNNNDDDEEERGGAALRALNDAIDACALHGSDAATATTTTTTTDTTTRALHMPRVRHARELHPLVVYVHPGETLYLPAMWLHRVAQHADEHDIRARHANMHKHNAGDDDDTCAADAAPPPPPPLPLIAAVNYWYNMSFTNPAVVMLREFGLLL